MKTCLACNIELVNGQYNGAQLYCSTKCRERFRSRRRQEAKQRVAQNREFDRITDQDWRIHAACIGKFKVNWFPETLPEAEPALAVCERCPVIQFCYNEAIRQYENGIWGASYFRYGVPHRLMRCVNCDHLHTTARCPKPA